MLVAECRQRLAIENVGKTDQVLNFSGRERSGYYDVTTIAVPNVCLIAALG